MELGNPISPGFLSPSVNEADRYGGFAYLCLPTVLECQLAQGTHGLGVSEYSLPLSPAAPDPAHMACT